MKKNSAPAQPQQSDIEMIFKGITCDQLLKFFLEVHFEQKNTRPKKAKKLLFLNKSVLS